MLRRPPVAQPLPVQGTYRTLSQETCLEPTQHAGALRAKGQAKPARLPPETRASGSAGADDLAFTLKQTRSLLARAVVSICAVALATLAGCSTAPSPTGPAPRGEPRLLRDELGREVRVARVPTRIVSLAPSVTESLFALGVGHAVVGATSFCDYPPEAAAVERVGDTVRPSLEKIVAKKPDLVIVSTSSQLERFAESLEEIGIPVWVSNPRSLDGIVLSIERLGDVIGQPEAAARLVSSLRARIGSVVARVANRGRPRVLLILGGQPLITIGANSFVTDLITSAGGDSISDDVSSEYPQYSLETAVARQPEVIFLQAGNEPLPMRLKETTAFRDGRVFQLDPALLLRPGPRIVDGLEAMAAKIHPAAFSNVKEAGRPE